MLGSGISLIWCNFYPCLLSNWLFAEFFSNCSNSLNYEAKINCNSIKPNVPKWRKTCTGLNFICSIFMALRATYFQAILLMDPVGTASQPVNYLSEKLLGLSKLLIILRQPQQQFLHLNVNSKGLVKYRCQVWFLVRAFCRVVELAF